MTDKKRIQMEVFASFLMKLSTRERFIEIKRQLLSDKLDFEPYNAFQRITRGKNGISSESIAQFLKDNLIEYTSEQVIDLVTYFDIDRDGVLSLKEFMNIILPQDNPELRSFVTQKECVEVNKYEYLSYESEASLAELINIELSLVIEMIGEKEKIDESGLDASSIIHMIDRERKEALTFENLTDFLNDCGLIPYEPEIIGILRILDKDKDGIISNSELQYFFSRLDKLVRSQKDGVLSHQCISKEKLQRFSPNRKLISHFPRLISNKVNEITLQEIIEDERRNRSNVYRSKRRNSLDEELSKYIKQYPIQNLSEMNRKAPIIDDNVENKLPESNCSLFDEIILVEKKLPKQNKQENSTNINNQNYRDELIFKRRTDIVPSVSIISEVTEFSNSADISLKQSRRKPSIRSRAFERSKERQINHLIRSKERIRQEDRSITDFNSTLLKNSRASLINPFETIDMSMKNAGTDSQISAKNDQYCSDKFAVYFCEVADALWDVETMKMSIVTNTKFNSKEFFSVLKTDNYLRCYLEDFERFIKAEIQLNDISNSQIYSLFSEIKLQNAMFFGPDELRKFCERTIPFNADDLSPTNSRELDILLKSLIQAKSKYYRSMNQLKKYIASDKYMLNSLFENIDQNGQRYFELVEFLNYLQTIDIVDVKKATLLFSNIDLDKNGRVTFKDLYLFMSD